MIGSIFRVVTLCIDQQDNLKASTIFCGSFFYFILKLSFNRGRSHECGYLKVPVEGSERFQQIRLGDRF